MPGRAAPAKYPFLPARPWRWAIWLLIAAATIGCREREPDLPGAPAIEMIARSAPVPYSRYHTIAVVSPHHACMLESYAIQIVCGDRRWQHPVSFAAKGSGPGEILPLGYLIRVSGGGLGYVHLGNRRLTLYSPKFQYERTVRIPFPGLPVGDVGPDSMLGLLRPTRSRTLSVAWISIRRDSVVRRQIYRAPESRSGRDTAAITGAAAGPDGEMVLRLGLDRFSRQDAAGHVVQEIEPSGFGSVHPTERDVARYTAELTALFHAPPPAAEIQRYRRRPMPWSEGHSGSIRPVACGSRHRGRADAAPGSMSSIDAVILPASRSPDTCLTSRSPTPFSSRSSRPRTARRRASTHPGSSGTGCARSASANRSCRVMVRKALRR